MRKCVLPLLLCAVLLCGCGGEKSLTVQDQYRTVVSADMEAEVVSRTASDDRTFTLTCRYNRAGQYHGNGAGGAEGPDRRAGGRTAVAEEP